MTFQRKFANDIISHLHLHCAVHLKVENKETVEEKNQFPSGVIKMMGCRVKLGDFFSSTETSISHAFKREDWNNC